MNNFVLWLVSWYPNRTSAYDGDFIERHSKAVSAYANLIVIFVTKDEELGGGKYEIIKEESDKLIVYRGYYGKGSYGLFERLKSGRTYFSLQKKIYKSIVATYGAPKLVHVHVAMKAGLFARYLKRRKNIPYLISEHWSGYYPKSPNSIYKDGFIKIQLLKSILRNSSQVLPVAQCLDRAIKKLLNVSSHIIPNVVDTTLFFYKPKVEKKIRFIHPSSMNKGKNPEGILRSAKALSDEGFEFELVMVGSAHRSLLELASSFGILNTSVFFRGEISYSEVATEMQLSSALIMFSRFESLPCVVIEALCCGLPVISSDVGGLKEIIDDKNGILVDKDNESELKKAMKKMISTYSDYNQPSIAENASSKFNYGIVGKEIYARYLQIIL